MHSCFSTSNREDSALEGTGAIDEAKRTDRFYAESLIREESLLLGNRDVLEKYMIQRLCSKHLVTDPLNLVK